MKQVWKCDHCSKTNSESKEIEAHEKTCSWNKAVKSCWTCEHHVDKGMPISGSMYVCQKGKSYDFVDDNESKGGCEIWKEIEDFSK